MVILTRRRCRGTSKITLSVGLETPCSRLLARLTELHARSEKTDYTFWPAVPPQCKFIWPFFFGGGALTLGPLYSSHLFSGWNVVLSSPILILPRECHLVCFPAISRHMLEICRETHSLRELGILSIGNNRTYRGVDRVRIRLGS